MESVEVEKRVAGLPRLDNEHLNRVMRYSLHGPDGYETSARSAYVVDSELPWLHRHEPQETRGLVKSDYIYWMIQQASRDVVTLERPCAEGRTIVHRALE